MGPGLKLALLRGGKAPARPRKSFFEGTSLRTPHKETPHPPPTSTASKLRRVVFGCYFAKRLSQMNLAGCSSGFPSMPRIDGLLVSLLPFRPYCLTRREGAVALLGASPSR